MKSFFESKTGDGFNATKVKAHLRMAVTRLNMQKNKLVNSVKTQRRSIAELLAVDKYDSARIRVENCIREDVNIEGYEVLSLFLELLGNRVQLMAESKPMRTADNKKDPCSACPPELKEAISSVLWASARVGDVVPELSTIRKNFEAKYGKAFVQMAISNSEYSVNQRMMERLSIYTPSNDKCLSYLTSIAKEFQLGNYDEGRLKDPSGVMASATNRPGEPTDSLARALQVDVPGGTRTPSGLYIPPMVTPRDALDYRLLRLKRV